MIIVKLTGGIGNQMFQYAFAWYLSIKHNTEIKIDLQDLSGNIEVSHEQLWLNVFNIQLKSATKGEVFYFKRKTLYGSTTLLKIHKYLYKKKLIEQVNFDYKKVYEKNATKNSYLVGFWQSEKFFKNMKEEILRLYSFPEPDIANKKITDEISQANSISIHIRRGDYLTNPENFKNHGVCSLEYYKNAVHQIIEKVTQPFFYIFTDDINWVKKEFHLDFPYKIVGWNTGDQAYRDMQLMSYCKHNIIANSSFSWWGAWLNKNPEKVVIAPKNWFNERDWNTEDIIPKEWIKM